MAKIIQIRTLRMRAAAADTSLSEYVRRALIELAAQWSAKKGILRPAGDRGGGVAPGAAAEPVRKGRDS